LLSRIPRRGKGLGDVFMCLLPAHVVLSRC